MNLIDRLQAGRYARRLQEADPASNELATARSRLVAMGAHGVRVILDGLKEQPATEATLGTLEQMLDERTLSIYVEALHSGDRAVADTAMQALARGRGYDPVQLLSLFADARVSKARLETILNAHVDRIAPRALLAMLPEMSREARATAVRLVELRADASILHEATRLAQHADPWLRLCVAKLLGKIAGEASARVLSSLLSDDTAAVRLEAVKSLQAIEAPETVPALCARLRDPDMKVQSAAIGALVSFADVAAVPHLLEHLKDESEHVRRGAVEVLNEVVTVDAIKDLVGALRDADWWVRVRAADALGTLGGERVVDAVIALVDDSDEFLRRYAVEILNMVPNRRAVETLIRALDDTDWWVRERAVDALGRTGDPRAVEPLLALLHRDLKAAPHCARALGGIADARAIEPLCRLVESDDSELKREATQALALFVQGKIPNELRAMAQTALAQGNTSVRSTSGPSPATERPYVAPKADLGPRPATPPPSPSRPPMGIEAGRAPDPAPRQESAPALGDVRKLPTGTVLTGRYRVLQRIGGGGFGTVYLVEDTVVREEMALKILSPQFSMDEVMVKRFVQELKLTRRVSHPNVIRIHDMIEIDGAHAISMEYFPGSDLRRILTAEGKLPLERALRIGTQALEGLAAAHELGIVHRDIKPANLLVGANDVTKLADFGLASVAQTTQTRITQSALFLGTPEYVSPEQIIGKNFDARSDLYALGVVLYEAISGKQPFAGTTAVNTLFQHLQGEIPRLRAVAPDVPEALDALIFSAMARVPDERPGSAREMLESLRKAA